VKVSSRRGQITLRVLVTGRSPVGVIFIPFHFAEAAANVLTLNRVDSRAKIPDYKVCAVQVEKTDVPEDREGVDIPLTERGAIQDRAAQVH
jgi:predicted molibdopterin-dependent oxidoreductase YjgC